MEDLPLGKIAALVPEFAVKDLPLGRTHDDDDDQFYFWSVNSFRHTMHSKSTVVNAAEPSWNAFGKQVSNSVQQPVVVPDIWRLCPLIC